MFYKETIAHIINLFPGVVPNESPVAAVTPEQILWMCQKIAEMPDDTVESALKAARWMGWVLCAVEISGVGWTNQHSRNVIRHDVLHHSDQPHSE